MSSLCCSEIYSGALLQFESEPGLSLLPAETLQCDIDVDRNKMPSHSASADRPCRPSLLALLAPIWTILFEGKSSKRLCIGWRCGLEIAQLKSSFHDSNVKDK